MLGLYGRKGFIDKIQLARTVGIERNHAHELLAEAFLVAISADIGTIESGLTKGACRG